MGPSSPLKIHNQAADKRFDSSDIQRIAANPGISAFVSASAGSGKTKVLTDRLLMLLLTGSNPRRLLCLTFTKAAAGEMLTRLLHRLERWATENDDILFKELTDFLGGPPTAAQWAKARALFIEVLEESDGLKIQTLHGFCQGILTRFPLEAGVSATFQLIDDGDKEILLSDAFDQTLKDSLKPGSPLGAALENLSGQWGDQTLFDMALDSAQWATAILAGANRGDMAIRLNEFFERPLEETVHQKWDDGTYLRQHLMAHGSNLPAILDALMEGSDTDKSRADTLIHLAETDPWDNQDAATYIGLFLTADGTPRKTLATKKVRQLCPHGADMLNDMAIECATFFTQKTNRYVRDITHDLMVFLSHFWRHYGLLKGRLGVLDYDDLIDKTLDLLHDHEFGPWILYQLDGGIEHLLIDESQDTNPQGWALIRALSDDFYTGAGKHGSLKRTFFSVGDSKQSIYSFQGSDAQLFPKMEQVFERQAAQSGHPFHRLSLDMSYRSVPEILSFVDHLFNHTLNHSDGSFPSSHTSFKSNTSGSVILLPAVYGPASNDDSANTNTAARNDFCNRLAGEIKDLLERPPHIPSRNRPLNAGDILILVRARGGLVYGLTKAIHRVGIGVMGEDRLNLHHEIAILDLLALGEFLIQTDDDLNTACVLRSPFCGISDGDLDDLGRNRGHETLWSCFKKRQGEQAHWTEIFHRLDGLLNKADFLTPFDLFSYALYDQKGLDLLKNRLGNGFDDAIEEFLTKAYDYERFHVPSLAGFLEWFDAKSTAIKRDLSASNTDKIRIMTVHGSKGLQAPLVILADTFHTNDLKDTFLFDGESALVLWNAPADKTPGTLKIVKENQKKRNQAEYYRLLYVAMTRAEDHLYLAGFSPKKAEDGPKTGTWYDGLSKTMASLSTDSGQTAPIETRFGTGTVYGTPPLRGTITTPEINREKPTSAPPPWLFSPHIQTTQTAIKSVTSSNDADDAPPVHPFLSWVRDSNLKESGGISRQKRGEIIHVLLDFWTRNPINEKTILAAERRIMMMDGGISISKDAAKTLIPDALRIWNHPNLKNIFHSKTGTVYTEVPITGILNGTQITGRLDRLMVFQDQAWLIDYKTDKVPPFSETDVFPAYRQQMAIYADLLMPSLLPRKLRSFFLWTENCTLMELCVKPPNQ